MKKAQSAIAALDRQRERWRRARRAMRLDDQTDEQFALGGLGRRVPDLTARIVILPADPDDHRIEFDEDFWKLWTSELKGPFPNRELRWGSSAAPTAMAAARCDEVGDGQWGRYAALDHGGSSDIGLGDQGGWRGEHNGLKGVCFLLPIVATVWEVCHVYGQLAERFGLERPWELSVALRQTNGTVLGEFATGWSEPGSGFYRPAFCKAEEANILLRRELFETPEGWSQSMAYSVGVQIENAFGSRYQRFRTITDGKLGDFDIARWR